MPTAVRRIHLRSEASAGNLRPFPVLHVAKPSASRFALPLSTVLQKYEPLTCENHAISDMTTWDDATSQAGPKPRTGTGVPVTITATVLTAKSPAPFLRSLKMVKPTSPLIENGSRRLWRPSRYCRILRCYLRSVGSRSFLPSVLVVQLGHAPRATG